jgi:hypothetical protein
MVKVFMVDPGSKVSVMARLRVAPSAAPPESLGLNEGPDALARI